MNVGGVEQVTFDLAEGLVALKHQVFLLSHGGEMIPALREKGVQFFSAPFHKKDPLSIYLSVQKTRNILKMIQPDIAHAGSRIPAWAAYLACNSLPPHFVTTFHSFYNRHLPSIVMARGEKVITVSNALAQYANKCFGVSNENIRVVHNGVRMNVLSQRKNNANPIFGILGRLTQGKGFELFVHIINKLNKQITATACMGLSVSEEKKHYLTRIQKLIGKFQLEDRISILINPDRERFFEEIDIYVGCATKPEGFGRTYVEAQLAGIPVVISSLGAADEVVLDKKTGFLVPPNAEDFLLPLLKLFNDVQLRQLMGETARKWAGTFSVSKMVNETVAVYEELVNPSTNNS